MCVALVPLFQHLPLRLGPPHLSKIAYILLCHKDPDAIIAQAEALASAGDFVSIHFDANASQTEWDALCDGVRDIAGIVLAEPRVRCGWGEWSLVKASLCAIRSAHAAFEDATHFYMLSGDCFAIKTAEYAHAYLDAHDCDWIESFDYFESNWIKTGMKEERLIYRHFFNERTQPQRFYASYKMQERLGLKRPIPKDLQMMIGSQWWCLRRSTIDKVLAFCDARPDVMRFFATTWIPDETFFQTLVRHLVPETEIQSRTLTFLLFTDYGMPVVFHDDHHDMLLCQDYLFARKISPEAKELRARLAGLYLRQGLSFPIVNEGRKLFEYVTTRGRVGLRAAPRFWETEASIGRDRDLMLIVSKKWHVAKRLLAELKTISDLPCVEFMFSEASTPLPDLGGIEQGLEKRSRHRRALVRLLFEYHGQDRLVICVDPSDFDLIEDFYADRCTTRLLEINSLFSDAYLVGHANRNGLAGKETSEEIMGQLLPTIRQDIGSESDRINDANWPGFHSISQTSTDEQIARTLASFFGLSGEQALQLARTPNLFDD